MEVMESYTSRCVREAEEAIEEGSPRAATALALLAVVEELSILRSMLEDEQRRVVKDGPA